MVAVYRPLGITIDGGGAVMITPPLCTAGAITVGVTESDTAGEGLGL